MLTLQLDGFKCKRCGTCCRVYAGTIQVTEQDILRWAVEFRDDILQQVSVPDSVLRSVTNKAGYETCPFLKKLRHTEVCVCSIYRTRPETCVRFPISKEHAERMGCQGWKQ